MSEQQRCVESEYLTELLKKYISESQITTLAMFYPLGDEIDILPIAEFAVGAGCRVLMPRMCCTEESLMEFYDFSSEAMAQGNWGVMEPQRGVAVGAGEIELMIVPGVAFTACGERLGRGKGYYDRYMSRQDFKAQTIGVCFAHQLLPTLPVEPHDRRVDRVFCGKSKK